MRCCRPIGTIYRASSRTDPEGSTPEPASVASCPPRLFFFEELSGRSGEFGDWGVVAQEVDVDASHEFVTELDITGSGENAAKEIGMRSDAAKNGIGATLAAIKGSAEA
jgi:hypothetical protein